MELSLDLSLNSLPKNVSQILEQVSNCKNKDSKVTILDDYVKRLEDELKKIEAFSRELPLSILLLNDVIVRLKDELKHLLGACNEKKEWMSSAQLWTPNQDFEAQQKLRIEEESDRSVPNNPIQHQQGSEGGEAFVLNSGCTRNYHKEGSPVPSLSLMMPLYDLHSSCKSGGGASKGGGEFLLQSNRLCEQKPRQQQQSLRKQRRCWSPELHRRFVEALRHLGGSQAATPKQIRELMQVDGLTNDEVKSHLQKYRLHVRRLPGSPTAATTGVWMAQDRDVDHPKANISQTDSPQGPLPASGSCKGVSSIGDDSIDAEYDEKSEVRSWKAELHKAV